MSIADISRLTLALAFSLALATGAAAQAPVQEPAPATEEEQQDEVQPADEESSEPTTDESADAEPAAAEEPSDPGPPKPADSSEFTFSIDDESGGGQLAGWAGAMQGPIGEPGEHALSGGFSVRVRDYRAWGDELFYDQETEQIRAEGSIVLIRGNEVLRGSRLELDLATETASIFDVEGNLGTDYFFTGAAVHKLSEERFTILDAQFTACEVEDGETPDWSFRAKKVHVNASGYAKTRGVSFRAKNVPLVYLPYMLWPVKTSRVSGFLMPKPGFSTRRGPSLGIAYFWAINRSYDATLNVDLYAGAPAGAESAFSERPFWGAGTEFRYRPSEGTEGIFDGYVIDDTERGEKRWRMRWNHQSQQLPGGFRGVVRFEDVSDFDFFRDFERRVDRNSRRQLYSTAFMTRNWGSQSINVQLDQRKTFISADRTVQLRQLPEIEYKLRSTRLGDSPVYVQLKSSLHYLDTNRSARRVGRYARANLEPEISVPIRMATWLSLSLTAGGHLTWYGDSLMSAQERRAAMSDSDFRGEDLMRLVPTARAELVGPGFSRIFELGEGGRFSRMKHLIEPASSMPTSKTSTTASASHCSTRSTTCADATSPASACSTVCSPSLPIPKRAAPSRSSRSSSFGTCRSTARNRCCARGTAPSPARTVPSAPCCGSIRPGAQASASTRSTTPCSPSSPQPGSRQLWVSATRVRSVFAGRCAAIPNWTGRAATTYRSRPAWN